MTSNTTMPSLSTPSLMTRFRWGVSDTLVMVGRNLLRYVRLPENIVNVTVSPIMFLLLFTYVLGGAIRTSTPDYITFVLPGILVQTLLFGGFGTALGLAQDVQSGLFDRYRSLPMSRSAVIVGRLVADLLSNIFVAVLMIGIGMLIGFRFGGSFLESIGSPAIGILFALPAAAIFAAVGLTVRSVEAVNVIGFTLIFPITFVSSAFVPVESMPSWLQPVAEANPFSLAVDASRSLALGEDPGSSLGGVLIWVVVLSAIGVPLAVRAYSRRS